MNPNLVEDYTESKRTIEFTSLVEASISTADYVRVRQKSKSGASITIREASTGNSYELSFNVWSNLLDGSSNVYCTKDSKENSFIIELVEYSFNGSTTISDATISISDITTNNFTTTKHGFVPKGTNVGNFLKDDGTWSVVSGVLADGDKGDITVSGTGTIFTIDSGVVTLAKMSNMATASIIYRKTAGTGTPEVQTLATLKTDLGLTGTNSGDLVSGTTIKTINSTSLLGAGDIAISGAVADGDKGDITVSASGATWTIDAGAVTLAKQANMATGSVVYRKTTGAGAPEIQTLATLKTDLGLTGTNSGDQDLSSKQDTLVSGTNIKTINSTSILGAGDVVISGSVTDGDKGDITVSASGATWTIDARSVTLAKQANMATASVIYRKTAGSGAPEVQTLATLAADLPALNQNTTGSAATLTTPRTINGISFNGSANITVPLISATITVAGTTHLLNASDNGNIIYCTSASPVTITTAVGLGIFQCLIIQKGAGQVTIAQGASTTLLSRLGLVKSAGQHAQISLTAAVANEFYLGGDLGA